MIIRTTREGLDTGNVDMDIPKVGKSQDGREMHYSVGAVIKRDDKYLLVERAIYPPGFAGLAGHVDDGETEVDALIREVKEESGLDVVKYKKLLEEEVDWNECSRGIGVHYWYLFECETTGEPKRNERESRSIDWYSPKEIKELNLEPVWKYWFEKLGII